MLWYAFRNDPFPNDPISESLIHICFSAHVLVRKRKHTNRKSGTIPGNVYLCVSCWMFFLLPTEGSYLHKLQWNRCRSSPWAYRRQLFKCSTSGIYVFLSLRGVSLGCVNGYACTHIPNTCTCCTASNRAKFAALEGLIGGVQADVHRLEVAVF